MQSQLLLAIEDRGFQGRIIGRGDAALLRLEVDGMACSTCSGAVEAALMAVPGVLEASANAISNHAEVRYDPDTVGPRTLLHALAAAGYEARPAAMDPGADGSALREREKRMWRRKFLLSLAFSIPLFTINMILMMIEPLEEGLDTMVGGFPVGSLVSWALATPVQFYVGWVFHWGAWRALRRGRPNMDVLVSIGTNAAYIYSIIAIVWSRINMEYASHGNFFETSALLITFICLGKYLEAAAKGKTSQAISKLLRLAPDTAVLCTSAPAEGADAGAAGLPVAREEVVSTALLQRGDLVKIVPGARVPVDGEVVAGRSHVDESMVTGEPVPESKSAGDAVIGGTVNCGGGVLRVRALRVGADTTLSQIVRLVENAQMSKAPIQAYADRISAFFVPLILVAALATWLGWYVAGVTGAFPQSWVPAGSNHFLFALLFGIAVVVIACPCALGLATPTAIMVGSGVAASHGILIKSAEALERAHRLRHIVFDKTGTLTMGEPSVVDHHLLPVAADGPGAGHGAARLPLETVLLLAASAETGSEHPLGRAVLRYAGATLACCSLQRDSSGSGTIISSSSSGQEDAGGGSAPATQLHRPLAPAAAASEGVCLQVGAASEIELAPFSSVAPARAFDQEDVAWLAPSKDMEAVPGSGVRCWVTLPLHKVAVLLPAGAIEATSSHAALAAEGGAPLVTPQLAGQPLDGGAVPGGSALALGRANDDVMDVRVAVGNRKLMQEEGVAVDPAVAAFMRDWEAQGMTCVLMAAERRLVACFAIADQIRPEAQAVVAALHKRGLQVGLGKCLRGLTLLNWCSAGGRCLLPCTDVISVIWLNMGRRASIYILYELGFSPPHSCPPVHCSVT